MIDVKKLNNNEDLKCISCGDIAELRISVEIEKIKLSNNMFFCYQCAEELYFSIQSFLESEFAEFDEDGSDEDFEEFNEDNNNKTFEEGENNKGGQFESDKAIPLILSKGTPL